VPHGLRSSVQGYANLAVVLYTRRLSPVNPMPALTFGYKWARVVGMNITVFREFCMFALLLP
jgi:hypothetical protein